MNTLRHSPLLLLCWLALLAGPAVAQSSGVNSSETPPRAHQGSSSGTGSVPSSEARSPATRTAPGKAGAEETSNSGKASIPPTSGGTSSTQGENK